MKIGKIDLNKNKKPILISEISGNHGEIKLVRKAAKNGADLVKLQTYDAKSLL